MAAAVAGVHQSGPDDRALANNEREVDLVLKEQPLHPPARHRRDYLGAVQALCLAGLCAVGSELLAAYAENTGKIAAVLFALVFFAALYGAPALLAREVARRFGWGWPSLLLLTLALGIAQACLIDQSLFSQDYVGYEGWAESRQAAFIPALSVSANQAFNFIIGHVIFSFAAPIAVAEAWRPDHAHRPWLGPVGIAIAAMAYGGTAVLIASEPESHSASVVQFTISAGLAAACVAAAWFVGRNSRLKLERARDITAPAPLFVFAVALLPARVLASDIFGESWDGFLVNVVAIAVIGGLIWRQARRQGWDTRHIAAIALAFLVSRGLLAFTYFPLAGQVEPFAKYAHNVAMMLAVLMAGSFALRPSKSKQPTS